MDRSVVIGNQALATATVVGNGGGLYFEPGAGGSIDHSVITDNTTNGYGGGIYLASSAPNATVSVANSIIANNTAPNHSSPTLDGPDAHAQPSRAFNSMGNNRLTQQASFGFDTSHADYFAPVGVTPIIVTGLTDTYNRANDLLVRSLRDSIDQANLSPVIEEIWLPGWNFRLTIGRTGQTYDMSVQYGDLDITTTLTMRGVEGSTFVRWRTLAATDSVFELLGDYNLDGTTNYTDYTAWVNAFGTTNLSADGNDDGFVDASDYTVWADHQGRTFTKIGVLT